MGKKSGGTRRSTVKSEKKLSEQTSGVLPGWYKKNLMKLAEHIIVLAIRDVESPNAPREGTMSAIRMFEDEETLGWWSFVTGIPEDILFLSYKKALERRYERKKMSGNSQEGESPTSI